MITSSQKETLTTYVGNFYITFNDGMRFYYTKSAIWEGGSVFTNECPATKEKINFLYWKDIQKKYGYNRMKHTVLK